MPRQSRLSRKYVMYHCEECGKLTRETGEGESNVGMCRRCYEQAEWNNYVSDGGDINDVPEEYQQEARDYQN